MSDNRTLDLLFRKERNFDTVPKSASRAARLEYLNADLIRRFANENGENGAENLEAHLIENTKVTVDFTPLSTKNKRESMNANWCSYLKHTARHLAESVYWHYETVVKHGPGLLHYLSLLAKPRAKYDTQLRSKTVDGWASTFINVVISNTVHPDGEKAGYAALLDGGLVKDLDNKKKTLVHSSDVNKDPIPKEYFGEKEMHLILTHSIDRSKYSRRKRQVVLNNGFRYLCSLIMLCRPSTLGPPDQFTLESGEYPRLRDLKFFRTAAGTWAIEVTLKHFKGAFRSTNSKQIKFTLRSVHMAHNVVLDPTTWGIMYLFSRNAFEKKYKSVMEIFTDDSAELKIDPAMLDEPLFLRAFPSANGLTDQPALGRAATSSLNNDCAAVGLPRTGITAFRRGGANHLHMMIGASFTSDIMNHTTKESTILKQYYSQNTNNWEVVQLMLNEVKGEREAFAGEVKKWENERALFSSAAVNTLVGHKAIKTHLERVAEQRKEREARILQDPKVIAIDQRINDFWEESFEPCFSGDKAQRPRVRQNVSKLMKDAADEDYPDTEFVDKEEAEEAFDTLVELFTERRKLVIKLSRDDRAQAERAAHLAVRTGSSLVGTTSDRQQVVDSLNNPPEILLDAVKQMKHDIEVITGENLATWGQNSSDAIAMAEDDEEDVADDYHPMSVLDDLEQFEKEESEESGEVDEERVKFYEDLRQRTCNELADDSNQVNFLNIHAPEMRYAFMKLLAEPLERVDDYAEIMIDGVKYYHCIECGPETKFKTLYSAKRHVSQAHSEWRYYQASRATSPKRWVCTCGAGTEKPLKSSRAFTDHALSNECTDLAKHLELKSLHDKGINGVPPDGRPERKVRTATTVPANANVEALPAAPAPPREPSWHDLSNTDFETTGEVLLSIVEDIAASLPQDEMYTDGGSSFEHIQAYFDTALTLYEDSLDAPVFPTVD